MKAVILAGGFGTRIAEESSVRPKPMVEIGGRPILWHIMKIFSAHGIDDFVICAGYKGEVIREFFAHYAINSTDVTFDLVSQSVEYHSKVEEPWRVTVADTGQAVMTGGRLVRAKKHIGNETFLMTYGDCVSDVNIPQLIDFHRSKQALVTLTAIQPPGRFGALSLADESLVSSFHEKRDAHGTRVNGGFMVVEPEALELVEGDATSWEVEPLQQAAAMGRLHAYAHSGYWQNLDTLRDKNVLEAEWASGSPPWKIW